MGPMDSELWEDEQEEMRQADESWSPWKSEMVDEDDEELWDDARRLQAFQRLSNSSYEDRM